MLEAEKNTFHKSIINYMSSIENRWDPTIYKEQCLLEM